MGTKCIVFVLLFVEYLQYIQNIQGSLQSDSVICPSNKSLVATMCENSHAEEEGRDGNISVDSVYLRVLHQEDRCVCKIHVTFNLNPPAVIKIRNIDATTTTPTTTNGNCGLVIDIMKNGSEDKLDPIECQSENEQEFNIGDLEVMQLISRQSNGSFPAGYCVQIYRIHSNDNPASLTLTCIEPENYTSTDTMITTDTTEVFYSTYNNGYLEDSTIIPTSAGDTMTADFHLSYVKTESLSTSHTEQKLPDTGSQNDKTKLYTTVGLGAGGGLCLVVTVVGVVCCMCRRKPDENTHIRKSPVRNSKTEDYDSYGLKDNILYVSSDVLKVDDGKYCYVDAESSKSNAKDNAEQIGTYSTVDIDEETTESKRSDSTSQKPIASPSDGINTAAERDQANAVEYAVVDKTLKGQLSHVSSTDKGVEYALVNKIKKL